jgi:Asp-tRNA(Asn)/Glu-tRNA(Gln) amidotransferase A subunit family amidase
VPSPRLALCRGPHWDEADETGRRVLAEAAGRLAEAGAMIEPLELPPPFPALAHAHGIIMFAEGSRAFAHELRVAPDRISARLRERLEAGAAYSSRDYDAALELAAHCRTLAPSALFAAFDAILTLSAPGEAPLGLESTGNPVFNADWTLLRLPCINLPGLKAPSGKPVGIQLVGKPRGDAALLAVAAWAHPILARD